MAIKRKTDDKVEKPPPKKPATKTVKAKEPEAQKVEPAPSAPKRMVLKTLKRTAAARLQSPTLRRVSGIMTRRVIPKAPPLKPAPAVPSPAPPAPSEPAGAADRPAGRQDSELPTEPKRPSPESFAPSPAPKAVPAVKESKKPLETKKEHPKSEPTATYKMPAPTPLKTPAPRPVPRPSPSPAHATPAGASATAIPAAASTTPAEAAPAAARQNVRIPEVVTVKDLSDKLNVKPIEVIKKLLGLGTMVTINQQIDSDVATLAADAFGFDVEIIPLLRETEAVEEKEDPAQLKGRPPVVTIMGQQVCWTPFAKRAWLKKKRAGSPSTSAPIA